MNSELLRQYNYDEFVPEKFMPWMRFNESPALGIAAPDFPLWRLGEDRAQTSLGEWWSKNLYLVVEFGSFT